MHSLPGPTLKLLSDPRLKKQSVFTDISKQTANSAATADIKSEYKTAKEIM
jgi:hypothetical protein